MLKKLSVLLTTVACCVFCVHESDAATRRTSSRAKPSTIAACRSVITLPNGNFVYKNSAPLRNSRGVMIGLRYEPTLIMKKRYSARSTTVYSAKGRKIGSCPKAPADGFAGGRMRCTMKTASLRRAAVKDGNPSATFTLGGGVCAKVPDAGRCYGSSKGGCNRLIK